MPALVAKLALALGFDTLLQWALRTLVALVIIGLLVTLIVVQTVAGVLTGGRTNGAAATVVGETHIVIPMPNPEPPRSVDLGTAIVDLAQTWLGVPYVFGGCTHAGVDCSCLVQNVYAAAGVRLPRVAVDQFNATVPVSDPQPGDLVFFANTYEPGISHVGIYIGNGLQINAPTTGQFVSVASVFTGYWGAHYAGARRVRA
jgi:cell wall-associated NlpC family hydrolase